MTIVITAADVFSAIDENHAVGDIRRAGGGMYRFIPGDGSPAEDSADYDSAVALADAFVATVEKNPQATGETIALKKALTRIAELEAKLAEAGVSLEAVAVDVVRG